MSKKPTLELVGATTSNPTAPPASLGEAGRKAWQLIQNEYSIADSGGLTVLAQIAAAHDRLAECQAIIATEGPVVRTKSGPREHPLLRTELGCRAFIVRAISKLGLDVEPLRPGPGRPPGLGY